MNWMKATAVSCAVLMIGACTYSKTTTTLRIEGGRDPVTGVFYAEITNTVENTTITITGDTVKEIISKVPKLDASTEAAAMLKVRYEYRFDVYNIYGVFVGTVSVETLPEALEILPDLFVLGGLDVPPAAELIELENDLIVSWISPKTHWLLFH